MARIKVVPFWCLQLSRVRHDEPRELHTPRARRNVSRQLLLQNRSQGEMRKELQPNFFQVTASMLRQSLRLPSH